MAVLGRMTSNEVLELLWRMDEGYRPTKREWEVLREWIDLYLWNKRLNSLPDSIGNLTGLTRLELTRNQLTSLPDSIGKLSVLTSLDLSHNQLTSLPKSLANLTVLTDLDLSGNPLTSLPEWIGELSHLETLLLSYLTLDRLPRSLLNLNLPFFCNREAFQWNDGIGIYLENTTLSLQPISLFDQSHDTPPDFSASRKLIEDYFHAKHIPLRESKVILLGDAASGKTYTVQRLLHDCQKGDYPTETTHGILIEDLHPVRDGAEYTVRIWDFGGQDIMNEMHRCFLTERTCYVILVDTRNNGQTQRARRWLRTVRSVAPKAPVVLLVNEMTGGVNLDLDAVSLRLEFPNLIGVHHCSAKDAGQESFRENVERPILDAALGMDSCKMTLPESWEQVRQELLDLRKKDYYIDRDRFHRLCDAHGVPADDQLRVWLLNWFNDMGVCFSYHFEDGQERKSDYKILEPLWLTSAIYRLIWEKEQNDDGIITRTEIELILRQEGSEERMKQGIPCLPGVKYEPFECEYVLEIMRKFCISYKVDDEHVFMPTLCKPDSKRDPAPARYASRVSVQFRYDLLPEKIIHELMIYCYRFLTHGKLWRKGFWLENPALGLCAVLFTTEEKDTTDTLQMDVYATAESAKPATWLQPLCKTVRELNSRSGLKAEEWVLVRGESEEKWFKLDTVWNWRKRNKEALMGDEEEFLIQPLLELVYGDYFDDAKQDYDIPAGREAPEQEPRASKLAEKIEDLITALNDNTDATQDNTDATQENTAALGQSKALLERIQKGAYAPPGGLMAELERIVYSNEKLLRAFQASQKKTKLGKLRELLGDTANLTTIAAALVPVLTTLIEKYPALLAH